MNKFRTDTIQLFKELVRFIASPDPGLEMHRWNIRTVGQVAALGLFVMLVATTVHFSVQFIFNNLELPEANSEHAEMIAQIPDWLIFIFACFVGPIGEELYVRLPLKPRLVNILISVVAGIGMLLFFNQLAVGKWYAQQPFVLDPNRLIPVGIIAFIALIYYWLPQRYQQHKLCFAIFLYATAFAFAVLHRFDRIHEPLDILLAFKDTMAQFISGLYFSFLRMKFGVRMSIISHAFWNFPPAILRFL